MTKFVEYQVEGSHDFPTDMLRYDAAWPHDTESAISIGMYPHFVGAEEYERFKEKRAVTLMSIQMPTDARWRSFGWKVVPNSIRKVG